MTGASTHPLGRPRSDLGDAALRAFFGIAERWGLDTDEQRRLLGDPPEARFRRWRLHRQADAKRDEPGRDTLERISYLLGIYKDLQILFPEPERADAWVRRPNRAAPFGGHSALERMLSGHVVDLYEVRRYLDAQRGGWS